MDTYQDERHPVAARAIQNTMAQAALQRRDERNQALVDLVSELTTMDEPRKRLAGAISGLDIHYDPASRGIAHRGLEVRGCVATSLRGGGLMPR